MERKYRVGIDLGTASVALAAYDLDTSGEPTFLAYHGVRLFDEPLEPGAGGLKSKAAVRRQARMQRRQIDRRRARQRRVARLANLLGLPVGSVTPRSDVPRIRARAVRERIELEELVLVWLRMSRRRGYAGEFSEKKKGAVASGSRALDAEFARVGATLSTPDLSLGEYLLWRIEHELPVKLKLRDDAVKPAEGQTPNLYALRRHVLEEFDRIWNVQQLHHPQLAKEVEGRPLREICREAIFHQRPLKSVEDKVGRCRLEPTMPRAPRAQPAFQDFRIEKTLADLRWGSGRRAEPLTHAQKAVFRQALKEFNLDKRSEVEFSKLLPLLEKAACLGPVGKGLNLDRASRMALPGDKTVAAFRKLGLADEWISLERADQIAVMNFLADLGSPEQLDDPAWRGRFFGKDGRPRRFRSAMAEFIDLLRAHEKFDTLAGMQFDGGRASYSVKAMERLTSWLRDPVWPGDWTGDFRVDEEMAVQICYPATNKTIASVAPVLERPPVTGNSVVDKALRQTHWALTRMMEELGSPPSEIVLEMAREMGLGIQRRNEREKDNSDQQRRRDKAAHEILARGLAANPTRIRRYLLWSEQDHQCPYCSQTISLEDALSGSASEYEHILPRKLTQVGLKTSEIVLAHHSCNQRKADRTPWGASQAGEVNWQAVESMAQRLRHKRLYRKAKLLLTQEFEEEVLTDESIAGFADRQFHATAWIAKEAAAWLSALCPRRVSVSRGELTAALRRQWKLDTVIPVVRFEEELPVLDVDGKAIGRREFEILSPLLDGHPARELRAAHPGFNFDRRPDKRVDNRHHLIDAMVIGLVSRGLFANIAKEYKRLAEGLALDSGLSPEERARAIRWGVRRALPLPPPPVRDLRQVALAAVRGQRISRKPDRFPAAAMFEDTAYSIARNDDPAAARLVLRKAVATLGGADSRKATLQAARSGISKIESEAIRDVVSENFERRIAAGLSPGQALAEPILHPAFGTAIKRVRCVQDRNDSSTAFRVEHKDSRGRTHWKYLRHDGYAWLDLWQEQNKVQHLLCTVVDAMRAPSAKPPAGVLRLFKGDVVRDSKDSCLYRICSFKAKGVVLYLPLVEPRSFKAANEVADRDAKVGGEIAFAQALKRFEVQ